MRLLIIGNTIELDGRPVATITAPAGTLRDRFEGALDNARRDVDGELNGAYDDGYKDGYDAARREYENT